MAKERNYLFGPVPSRRLGLSLGVDIVPFKYCTIDCAYCQIGRTVEKTLQRKEYISVEPVLTELREKIAAGLKADFITISGSGEPTLNSKLGDFIKEIKKITSIPVAILTNGTLFTDKVVRQQCALADVVLPSLDAGDEQTYQKINRPHEDLTFEQLIDGLCKFRSEFKGQIWLEVFLIEGINTAPEQICRIKNAIERIGPDKIQLNTAVRPTADVGINKMGFEKLEAISIELGGNAEVVADFSPREMAEYVDGTPESILTMLKRRPCSLDDICSGLGMHPDKASKYLDYLQKEGVVHSEDKMGIVFFRAN